jgi:hypothetical protein|tara:strand:- start:100 stop:426 length:327 start_codon:yes stop_codon:yes gene_type:complete
MDSKPNVKKNYGKFLVRIMSWKDIIKSDEFEIVLQAEEKLHDKKTRLKLEKEIEKDPEYADYMAKVLIKEIRQAMRFNEGKEYQELKEMLTKLLVFQRNRKQSEYRDE